MNAIFVLMGSQIAWESDPFCVGEFSTHEKAEEMLPKADKMFPTCICWTTLLDDFIDDFK